MKGNHSRVPPHKHWEGAAEAGDGLANPTAAAGSARLAQSGSRAVHLRSGRQCPRHTLRTPRTQAHRCGEEALPALAWGAHRGKAGSGLGGGTRTGFLPLPRGEKLQEPRGGSRQLPLSTPSPHGRHTPVTVATTELWSLGLSQPTQGSGSGPWEQVTSDLCPRWQAGPSPPGLSRLTWTLG